ncbi:unnamed protein product [Meloidogyne enterolobii]|uniref:Uncharacterized protein n=1 Tax=Meloidogyne enterolobii TaxID=390850 RepID=A0ACB0Z509_MELEN
MKLEQQTQISSPPKIKKLEQGRTTLPLELLVDVFRTINTYSDGFPTDLALDTDIAIIKAKQQELWSKYAKKLMTSSLIVYSSIGEAFRRSKETVGTLAEACGSSSTLDQTCCDPKCQQKYNALQERVSRLETALIEQAIIMANRIDTGGDRLGTLASVAASLDEECLNNLCQQRKSSMQGRISRLEILYDEQAQLIVKLSERVADCTCQGSQSVKRKKPTSSPVKPVHPCSVCVLPEAYNFYLDVMTCPPCRMFFIDVVLKRGGVISNECQYNMECKQLNLFRRCAPCRWSKCLEVGLNPKRVGEKRQSAGDEV